MKDGIQGLPDVKFFANNLDWSQGKIKMFGREIDEPRLSCFYGDPGVIYTYTGRTMTPTPWTRELLELKSIAEDCANTSFNTIFGNLYRGGKDHMGWHSDDEKELGDNPVIVSLNMGETRTFAWRERLDKSSGGSIELKNGDILVMSGPFQHNYQHCLKKTKKSKKMRINFTFRSVKSV